MYIVILAGGSGTRFWPLSRKAHPKQLMSVLGGKSMLQRTVERVLPLNPKRILIVTNELQAAETAAQLEYLGLEHLTIIAEPIGKNTAPAIGLAAAIVAQHDPDGIMAVLPADHYIADEDLFRETLRRAAGSARNGYLVTMGILPVRPETGYGYIEADKQSRGEGPYPVKRFVEKPDRERALEFLTAGNFYWNSGMFVWKACVIREEIRTHMPVLGSLLGKLWFGDDVWELADLKPQIRALYHDVPSESIDYGVMERSSGVLVIPASFGWSDVGSWSALPEVLEEGEQGNIAISATELISVDSRDCLVYGGGRVASLIGVKDLVVVATGDAVMVCAKERAQEVKKVVEELERRGMTAYL